MVAVAEVDNLFQSIRHVAASGPPSVIILDLTMPVALRDSIMSSMLVRGRLDGVPCFAISRFDTTPLLAGNRQGSGPGVLGAIARALCASCRCHERSGSAQPMIGS
jgi:hypothetical protein